MFSSSHHLSYHRHWLSWVQVCLIKSRKMCVTSLHWLTRHGKLFEGCDVHARWFRYFWAKTLFFLKMEQFFRNTEIDNFFRFTQRRQKRCPVLFYFHSGTFFCEIVRKLSSHKQQSAQEVQWLGGCLEAVWRLWVFLAWVRILVRLKRSQIWPPWC